MQLATETPTTKESRVKALRNKAKNAVTGLVNQAMVRLPVTYSSFADCARKFNVTAVEVSGDYGVFRSTVDDITVLGNYAVEGAWSRQMNALVRGYFSDHRGGTYVDIGANIGLTVVPIAQDSNVQCIALEPEPTHFANLRHNIHVNCPHDNVICHNVAAFSRRASLEFALASSNLGDHRIRVGEDPGWLREQERETIVIDAVPLDDIVGAVDGPFALKIDTQGAEPYVVEGGTETLRSASLLIMEFWPYGMHRMGSDPEKVLNFLERHFQKVSFWHRDTVLSADVPVSEAVARLRQFVHEKRDDSNMEYDLVAVR